MEKETLFLNTDQLLEAMRRDFLQYEPQVLLFVEILRLIEEDSSTFKRDPGQEGIWIRAPGSSHMRWLEGPELVHHMGSILERLRSPDERGLLAQVAGRVFQTRVRPEGPDGFGIETGMERFACQQCGQCCRDLDYHAEVFAEDVDRWRALGRKDILDWVAVTRHGDGSETYQIWVTPGTNRFAAPCPFLKKVPTQNIWTSNPASAAITRSAGNTPA